MSEISRKDIHPYLERQNVSLEECFSTLSDSTSQSQCFLCKKSYTFKANVFKQEVTKHLARCKEFLKIYSNDSIILREHLGLTTILKDLAIQYCFASPVKIFISRETKEVIVSQDNLNELGDHWEEFESSNIKKLSLLKIEYTRKCLPYEIQSTENTTSAQGTRRPNEFTPARRPAKQTKPNTPKDFLDADQKLAITEKLTKDDVLKLFSFDDEFETSKLAICKLCINSQISASTKHRMFVLQRHLKSVTHKSNLSDFEKDQTDFLHTTHPNLTFAQYSEMIKKSAIKEGVSAYAVVDAGVPLKAMEKLNQAFKQYDGNFACSRTKMNTIVKGPFLNMALSTMIHDLKNAKSIAIHFDSTTMHNKRMLTIFAKAYIPAKGHIIRCIDLRPIVKEDHETLSKCIIDAINNASIDNKNVVALVSDNANTNLGGVNHAFGDNVATYLQTKFNRNIIRYGCKGHIINNGFKESCKIINPLFNMKKSVNMVYSYFNQKPIRRDELAKLKKSKSTSNEKEQSFAFVRNFVETRWLSAYNSLHSLLPNFEILREYFAEKYRTACEEQAKKKSQENKKEKVDKLKLLNEFFSNNLNFVLVDVLEQISFHYFTAALKIQGNDITIMEGLQILDELHNFCRNQNFKSRNEIIEKHETKAKISKLTLEQVQTLKNGIDNFLETSALYFESWLKPYFKFRNFQWALFADNKRVGITKNKVTETIEILKNCGVSTAPSNDDDLETEVQTINELSMDDKFPNEDTTIDKWNFIFKTASDNGITFPVMEKVIAAILSISPTNAVSESIFSKVKHFWTDDKSNINFLSILAYFMIKYNLNMSLPDFKALLSSDQEFLGSLRTIEKNTHVKKLDFSDESESLITKFMENYGKELIETEYIFDDDFIHY